MGQEYDKVAKELLEACPEDWLRLTLPGGAGAEPPSHELMNVDLTAITGAPDQVIRVEEAKGGSSFWISVVEFMAYRKTTLRERARLHHALVSYKHECLVRVTIVLLKREANVSWLDGELREDDPVDDEAEHVFPYGVVRVWQLPTETLLRGGLGVLALAPISNVPEEGVEGVLERMRQRVEGELALSREEQSRFWLHVDILLGLRYNAEQTDRWLQGVRDIMRESTTFRAIETDAILRNNRQLVLELGEAHFNTPADAATRTVLESIKEVEQLNSLIRDIHRVGSWADLLTEQP